MSYDDAGNAARVPPHRPVDLWALPDVLSVEVRLVRYRRPRRYTLQGKDQEVTEAVEVIIETSEPFVIRALNPVLYVGDTPLTVAEGDGDRRYRFMAARPDDLEPGAPILLAWNSSGAQRKPTGAVYQPPNHVEERE